MNLRNLLRSLSATALISAALHAAPITWNAATNTTGKSNLIDGGTVVVALNGGSAAPTVSGGGAGGAATYPFSAANYTSLAPHTFAATGADAGDSPQVRVQDNAYAPSTLASTGDADFDAVIASMTDANGAPTGIATGTLTLTGLTDGGAYRIQVFYNDQRGNSGLDARVMTYGDGLGNTVNVAGGDPAPGAQIDHYGQHVIGSFTASGTTQELTMSANGFGNVHFNAIVVIDAAAGTVPTVTLSTANDPVAAPYLVQVVFSEDVTGLDESDFVVTNGAASALDPAGGPANSYSVLITPSASGPVTVALPADAVTDNDGDSNGKLASNTLITTYAPPGSDTPSATLSTTAAEPVSGPYTVEVVFSEDVIGLDASDFDVENGTASGLDPASGPASVYTVVITPLADGLVTVTLPAGAVVDVDGDNLPNTASNSLVTDHFPPTVPTAELFNPFTGSLVTGPYTVEIFFSEDVTGLADSDFAVVNGTASLLDPTSGPHFFFTLLITPTAPGLVSVTLPAGAVLDDDGENQTNPESNTIRANFLAPGTYHSGLLDLSGRDTTGLGAGESNGLFPSPKLFDSTTDFSLDDIPWSDGARSGSFDLSFLAAGSKVNIERGGLGAWGTVNLVAEAALVAPGASITIDTLTVSDVRGDLAGLVVSNVKILAIYLGNETIGDGATINGLVADGAPGGNTNESMRNDIEAADTVVVLGTGTGNGYSINGIEITLDAAGSNPVLAEVGFTLANEIVLTFSGLDTSTRYELRRSADGTTFIPVAGSPKVPASTRDTFTDPSPSGPLALYQLWTAP